MTKDKIEAKHFCKVYMENAVPYVKREQVSRKEFMDRVKNAVMYGAIAYHSMKEMIHEQSQN